jgi:hypothetical protein
MALLRDNFIYVIFQFQLHRLMHMKIIFVLVKLIFSSCTRFQNGAKRLDYILCEIKKIATETL